MRRVLALILGLGLIGSALAQQQATEPLTIVGPYYQLGTSSGTTYTISGAPGTYQVSGQAITKDATTNVLITITIPGSAPGPGPGPGPNPDPPHGIVGKMWVIYVVDTSSAPFATAGSFQSRLWSSNTIRAALSAPPISAYWKAFDKSDPLVGQTGWGKKALEVGLPCILIEDERGSITVVSGGLPADEASIVATARRARGL